MKRALSIFLSLLIAFGIFSGIPFTENAFDFLKIEAKAASTETVGDILLTLNDDGQSYSVIDFLSNGTEAVEIPSTYNGLPVTKIGNGAFDYNYVLSSITIPSTITSVGDDAFYECNSLKKVNITDVAAWCSIEFSGWYSNPFSKGDLYLDGELVTDLIIPEGVEFINSYAFQSLDSITSVKIPDSVIGIGEGAFSSCESLSTIKITDSVKTIGEDAFYNTAYYNDESNWENNVLYLNTILLKAKNENLGDVIIKNETTLVSTNAFYVCDTLTSVTIPDSVTSIGDFAFSHCDNLATVTIGSGVIDISNYAFDSCCSLKEFIVSENNPAYSSVNGLLLSKDKGTLLKYPSNKKDVVFTIPEYISTIASNAIEESKNLRLLVLGEKTISFEKGAVEVFGAVTLSQNNVKSFIDSGCYALKIYFDGTEEDFVNNYGVSFGEAIGEEVEYGLYEISYGLPVLISENDDYNYIVTGDNEIEIINCKNKVRNVTVPGEIEGLPVVSIGVAAFFSESTYFSEVIISAENSLLRVSLPESVKHISAYAFAFNQYLRTVDFNEGVVSVGGGTFEYCYQLCAQLPDSVKTIGSGAFSDCEYVGLGRNVESLAPEAINSNYVSIPSTVTGFTEYSIGLRSCITVYFEGTETEFTSLVDGNYIVFDFDGHECDEVIYGLPEVMKVDDDFAYIVYNNEIEIIGYNRNNTDVVIPETIEGKPVKTIGKFAFMGAYEGIYAPLLKTVSIPNTVEKIDSYAFHGNYELEELIIPDSVKYIGAEALVSFYTDIIIGSGVEYLGTCAVQTECAIVLPSTVSGFTDESIYCSKLYYDGSDEQLLPLLEAGYVSFSERELCDAKEFTVSGDYKYIVNGNNEAEILRYLGNEKVVSIPSEIDGLPVTALGNSSFFRVKFDCYYFDIVNTILVEELTIPDSVNEIGELFFELISLMGTIKSITANCYTYAAKYFDGVDIFTPVHNTSLDWQIVSEPTCTEDGLKHRGCTNCETGDNQVIPALGHNYNDGWSVDIEPTCTEYGSKSRICMRCGLRGDITPIDPLGHDFSTEWTVDLEPTCTEEGSKSQQCIRCNEKSSSTAIEPTGHTPGDNWYYSENYSCSYDESEERYKLCTVCGEKCETEYISGHIFNDTGFCEVCGYSLFKYKVNNDEVTITDYYGAVWDDFYYENIYYDVVNIPELIDGYPVTAIAAYAFDYGYISSVSIPKTVTSIGKNALPQYDEWNDYDYETNQCYEIIVDEENPVYCSVDGVLFNKNVTELIYYPVGKFESLYKVPETVTTIHDDCLYSYTDAFAIPLSVTYIGGDYLYYDEMGAIPPQIIYSGTEEQWNNISAQYDKSFINFETLSIGSVNAYTGFPFSLFEFDYVIKNDGTARIIGFYLPYNSYIESAFPDGIAFAIPEEIEGYPVVAIEDAALSGNLYLIGSLVIPDTITYIGKNNFYETRFYSNYENWENGMLYLGNHLIAVDECYSEVTIKPETLTIAKGALGGSCKLLTDEATLNYSSANGMLFNKDKTVLYHYPMGSNAKIPTTVTRFDDCIFEYSSECVVYEGTYDQWLAIDKGDNSGLDDIVVITKDCCIVKIGNQLFYMQGNNVLSSYSGIVEQDNIIYYVLNGVVDETFNGIYSENGNTYYFENGKVAFGYSGLYYNNGEWLYISEGLVDNDYTGIAYYQGDYYYVTDGSLDLSYSGVVQSNGNYYYLKNGRLDKSVTTLVCSNDIWYYIENGTNNWNYTGLAEYCGNYYHIANGVLDWGYTGLSYYNGNWWYVTNGVIDWSYTGLTCFYDTWYYVTNGFLDWNVTTLTYFYDVWYYVENGVLNWNYTGLAEFCGNYYHIANGVLDWGYTGLSYYNGNWWYVTNGVIDWNYTGLTYYYGNWYYVTNGYLDWTVTTLTYFYDVWYYVENGQINWNSNTLCYYGDTWYYVKGGTVAWDYTGWVEYYGGWYYITNGWLDWSKQ